VSGKLEEPNPLQNPADLLCLHVSDVLDPSTRQMICDTLLNTIHKPISPNLVKASSDELSKERLICAEYEIHQADYNSPGVGLQRPFAGIFWNIWGKR